MNRQTHRPMIVNDFGCLFSICAGNTGRPVDPLRWELKNELSILLEYLLGGIHSFPFDDQKIKPRVIHSEWYGVGCKAC